MDHTATTCCEFCTTNSSKIPRQLKPLTKQASNHYNTATEFYMRIS